MSKKAKGEERTIPRLFYDQRSGQYFLKLKSGSFLQLATGDAKLHLKEAGLSTDEYIGNLNEIEKCFFVAQTERCVDYAGPLAGYRVGEFLTADGRRVLVTSEPKGVFGDPEGEEPPTFFLEFLAKLLGTPQQIDAVLHWLKFAGETLRKGDFRAGQVLALAGPSGCGKSLLQALVTEFLGGRSAKPYQYMIGKTAFNGDLASAEHWTIEDENASTDIRTRRAFGASLKDATVNRELRVHDKGRKAITLSTYRRLTLSVNDEPENLAILPPMDHSIMDKVMLLKCLVADVGSDRSKTWSELAGDIPRLRAYVARLEVPETRRCARYGVKAYHHPDLLEILSSIAPETRLLSLIDEVFPWSKLDESWQGTSEQMELELRSSPFAFAVDKLLTFSSAGGTYLGRLAGQHPKRIDCFKNRGKTVWRIRRPSAED